MAKYKKKQRFMEVVNDKTRFDYRFSIDGTMVSENFQTDVSDKPYIDEDGDFYEENETIRVKFNKGVRRNIAKTVQLLLRLRGVKSIDNIGVSDNEVKILIDAMEKRGDVSDNQKIASIETIQNKYEPHYRTILMEAILWGITQKDLFSKKGKQGLEYKIDVPLDNSFFESEVYEEDEDERAMNELIYGDAVDLSMTIERNPNQHIELMIAIIHSILDAHEELADQLIKLSSVVLANVFFSSNQDGGFADDLGKFQERLERILPEFMDGRNDDGHKENDVAGIPVSLKAFGDSDGNKEEVVSSDSSTELST